MVASINVISQTASALYHQIWCDGDECDDMGLHGEITFIEGLSTLEQE